MTHTGGTARPLPQGDTPDELRAKIGESVHPDGSVTEIYRHASVDTTPHGEPDGLADALDGQLMVEVAVLLRQVIALCGGSGRAPSRKTAIIRTKAEEALVMALAGHLTGVD